MSLSTAGKNTVLDSGLPNTPWVSLHTDQPSDAGSNEVTGGSYARMQVTFGAASNGARAMTTSPGPTFNVPAGTLKFAGFWTAQSGGTFLGSKALDNNVTYSAPGTYQITSASLNAT